MTIAYAQGHGWVIILGAGRSGYVILSMRDGYLMQDYLSYRTSITGRGAISSKLCLVA